MFDAPITVGMKNTGRKTVKARNTTAPLAASATRAVASAAAAGTNDGQPPIASTEVARRAYEIFLSRGGSHGSDVQDWLQAERELAGL